MEAAGSMGAIAVTGCQELDEVHAGSTLALNLSGGVAVQTTPGDGGAGESGKSMISMQINLLFWTGFDVAEHKGYTTVNHVIVYQTIKLMYDGAKELAQGESDYSKYAILPNNQK
ncbi:guanine nucleotide-binding protein alpha-1 subunit-like isoform X2 [Triticum dicoccoides]|uniref:guanine nucleotide-binding protein alpha-1 subunit-like isoform X2 n=1 Tax=Triticum dicoccoides TaxID=85692 RepID=UPI0018917A47|nr:guanine nucleotide-binding protein alpha-1 subunit-like isoform X2 [Triticum dicoccoides]